MGEVEEAEADEEAESPIELQSGRTTAIGIVHYGVPADIVKHLSVRSLETFRPLSEKWHSFLGLASSKQGSQKKDINGEVEEKSEDKGGKSGFQPGIPAEG